MCANPLRKHWDYVCSKLGTSFVGIHFKVSGLIKHHFNMRWTDDEPFCGEVSASGLCLFKTSDLIVKEKVSLPIDDTSIGLVQDSRTARRQCVCGVEQMGNVRGTIRADNLLAETKGIMSCNVAEFTINTIQALRQQSETKTVDPHLSEFRSLNDE
jgi:hypothetical protein